MSGCNRVRLKNVSLTFSDFQITKHIVFRSCFWFSAEVLSIVAVKGECHSLTSALSSVFFISPVQIGDPWTWGLDRFLPDCIIWR